MNGIDPNSDAMSQILARLNQLEAKVESQRDEINQLQAERDQRNMEIAILSRNALSTVRDLKGKNDRKIKADALNCAGKIAGKTIEQVSKIALKEIPVVGLVAGFFLCVERWRKGEKLKAVGELASGGLSCVPLAGTVGSIALDAGLLADDYFRVYRNNDKELELARQHSIDAYELLGFQDVENNGFPAEAEVNEHYHALIREIHPDRAREGSYGRGQFEELTRLLNAARDLIYKHSNW